MPTHASSASETGSRYFLLELTTVTRMLEVAMKQLVTTTEIGKTPATETVGHYHRNRKDPSY